MASVQGPTVTGEPNDDHVWTAEFSQWRILDITAGVSDERLVELLVELLPDTQSGAFVRL